MEAKRPSGVKTIGDVSWGMHTCLFFNTRRDLIDILVPYFRAGLKNNEFCIWITSEPLLVEDAKKALEREISDLEDYFEKGQIEIFDYRQWYMGSGRFDPGRVLRGWDDKEKQAIGRGFAGLRRAGTTTWLAKDDWGAFTDYEEEVDTAAGQNRTLTICTYSIGKYGASEIIDVVNNHGSTLIKTAGDWKIAESAAHQRLGQSHMRREERYAAFEHLQECFGVYQALRDENSVIEDFEIVYVNNAACENNLMTKEEQVGNRLCEILPAHRETGLFEEYCQVVETGMPLMKESLVFEDYYKREYLSRAFDIHATKLGDGFIASWQDITDRKKSDVLLQENEARLKAAQQIAHIGNWDWNLLTDELYWSDENYRIFGLPPELVPSFRAFMDTVDPADRELVARAIDEAIRGKEPYDLEINIIRPDGQKRVVHTQGEVTWDEDGEAVRFFGTVQDITKRVQAEQALQASRDRLRILSIQILNAQEAERRLIAIELHDQTGQALTALKIDLHALAQLPGAGPLVAPLNKLAADVDETIGQIRDLALSLRPSILDDLGLIPAVRWYLDRTAAKVGFEAEFLVEGPEARLPATIETTCFRVIQEALTNISRHAEAKKVSVTATFRDDRLQIDIIDNGKGFDLKSALEHAVRGESLGLVGMQERVNTVGGYLELSSTPGKGGRVRFELPLEIGSPLERRRTDRESR